MQAFVKRKITFNERLYQIGESLVPPFALQFIIKGKGLLKEKELRACVKRLSELMPVLKLRLKGNTWASDGNSPRLIVHKSPFSGNWNDPLFRTRMDASLGNCAELHLFEGQDTIIIFRVLHSVMDAKGVQKVLIYLFDLLRGKSIYPDMDFPSDMVLRKKISERGAGLREAYHLKWPGFPLPMSAPSNYYTEVIRLDYRLDASLAKWAAAYITEIGQAGRLMIPVDLRRHQGVKDSASNLTLPVYLHVKPHQDWHVIQSSLLMALANNAELARERFERFGLMAPKTFLKLAVALALRRSAKTGSFPMSGILSDSGFIDLSALSTSSFQAEDVISLPVYVPLAPCCVTALHHSNGTNMSVSVPKGTNLSPVINRFLESLREDDYHPQQSPTLTYANISEERFHALRSIWAKELRCPEEIIKADTNFHHLGGDSLNLLSMLSNVAFSYIHGPPNNFFDEALKTGGHISIQILSILIEKYRS